MNVLIAGDSFAAEWPGSNGWVKLLAKKYNVKNVAQAGVSEYKILQQINTANLDKYDLVIVSLQVQVEYIHPNILYTKKDYIKIVILFLTILTVLVFLMQVLKRLKIILNIIMMTNTNDYLTVY